MLESAFSLHDRAFADNLGTVLLYAVVVRPAFSYRHLPSFYFNPRVLFRMNHVSYLLLSVCRSLCVSWTFLFWLPFRHLQQMLFLTSVVSIFRYFLVCIFPSDWRFTIFCFCALFPLLSRTPLPYQLFLSFYLVIFYEGFFVFLSVCLNSFWFFSLTTIFHYRDF